MQASTENTPLPQAMIVTTTENIPDTRVAQTLGQVFGLTVRSRSIGGNIAAALKSLAGGEIKSYVKLNEDARRQALDRMVANAAAMGANAVTMMRFDSTDMGAGRTEIVAYGTARVIVPVAAGLGRNVAGHRQRAGLRRLPCMSSSGSSSPSSSRGSSSPCSAGTGTGATARRPAADGASQPTSEAFIDPDTGRRMRVWYDPSTGQRDYRPE